MTQAQNRVTNTNTASAPAGDPRIAFFDRLAPTWDHSGPDPAATLERLRELEPRFDLRPGMDLLEVGCGTGQITGWLADRLRPGRVLAIDFSSAMLEQARARGVDAEFRLLDICAEAPIERKFDVVLCFHSFPHFRDRNAALANMIRVLKPTGRLLVVHLRGSASLNAFHQQGGGPVAHDHLPPAPAWSSQLKPFGLEVIRAEDRDDLFWVEASRRARISKAG